MAPYRNRAQAGSVLAERIHDEVTLGPDDDVIVLALPRGGVPVAFAAAKRLQAPMDVFLVRKLGVPGHEELAMGALATGGVVLVNEAVAGSLRLPDDAIDRAVEQETVELERRERTYREGRPPPQLDGRTVIVIDDGLATGSTMRAAVAAIRNHNPARIIVAVPAAARATCDALAAEVDQLVCAATPEPFFAVGQAYDDFSQTTDAEVRELLAAASS